MDTQNPFNRIGDTRRVRVKNETKPTITFLFYTYKYRDILNTYFNLLDCCSKLCKEIHFLTLIRGNWEKDRKLNLLLSALLRIVCHFDLNRTYGFAWNWKQKCLTWRVRGAAIIITISMWCHSVGQALLRLPLVLVWHLLVCCIPVIPASQVLGHYSLMHVPL